MGADQASQDLSSIGVSPELERLWRSLAALPRGDIAKHSGETGTSADLLPALVQDLLEFGLVREARGTPLGVVAVDPGPAIEAHLLRRERELTESVERIASIRAMIPTLRDIQARGAASPNESAAFEFVETVDGIRREVYAAANRVRADVRTLEPTFRHPADLIAAMNDGRTAQLETLARGIRDRNIIDQRILLDPEVLAREEEIRGSGGLIRTLPEVTSHLSIFDGDLAIVAIDAFDSARGAMLVRAPGLVDSLIFMFDHLWSIARPVFEVDASALPRLRGARILEFMAAGMKDDRIARALGVGSRTVRRDISELKDALGVNSRTEIVAAAAKRGWL